MLFLASPISVDPVHRYLAGEITWSRYKAMRRAAAEARPVVQLEVADRAAVVALAEAFGELAADMWLDGKFDLD